MVQLKLILTLPYTYCGLGSRTLYKLQGHQLLLTNVLDHMFSITNLSHIPNILFNSRGHWFTHSLEHIRTQIPMFHSMPSNPLETHPVLTHSEIIWLCFSRSLEIEQNFVSTCSFFIAFTGKFIIPLCNVKKMFVKSITRCINRNNIQ